MRAGRTSLTASALGLVLLTAACGSPGSSTGATAPASETSASASSAEAMVCEPVAGDKLVVLTDDKGLQRVDNIIPAVNAAAATASPGLIAVLDSVSAVVDTPTLVGLNKSVDVDRKTSTEVAAAFVTDKGLDKQGAVGNGAKIVVGAANFGESETLAAVYAGALTAAGFDASTQTIGNRETYEPALESGDVSVVPEYVGTLTEFLNAKLNGADAPAQASSDLDATVVALKALGEKSGLTFGAAAAAQDQNAFAVTTAFSEKYKVTTLSELATICGGGVSLGGPPECAERAFCQPGLEKTYGLKISELTALDAGGPLSKAALQQGKVVLGLVFSSDAALAS